MEHTLRQSASQRSHETVWPDMFVNLQSAYAELTREQFALERRRAEIEAERDLFLEVIESMSEAWFLMDRTGRVVRVNPAAGAMLECNATELVGRDFAEICGSAAIPATPWQLLESAPSGRLPHFHGEITTRTGRLVPINLSVGLVRDPRGKVVGMQVVARDITERKRAEEELERRRREAEVLADLARILNASLDLDTVLPRVVEGARELCSAERAIITLREPTSEVQAVRSQIGEPHQNFETIRIGPDKGIGGYVLRSGQPFRTEHYASDPRITKDYVSTVRSGGNLAIVAVPIWASTHVEGVLYVSNPSSRPFSEQHERILLRLAHHAAIAIENARRYRETRDVAERLHLFGQAIAGLGEVIVITDLEQRILFVNEAIRDVLGYNPQDLVGKSSYVIWAPSNDLGLEQMVLDASLADGWRGEAQWVRADGSAVPMALTTGLVMDEVDRPVAVVGVARDISERKRAEERLARQAQELTRSNAELEQFAYIASHDLQEPLRMMASFAQLLAKRYKGKLDADADEFIGYIVEGAARMQRLINDLLTYSRVDRRGQKFAPTDCAAVMAMVCANLRAAIEEYGAAIIADPLPVVMADETQLVQLFQNLLGNAIKFRGDAPVLVHVGAERRGSDWLFWVRDNGIGIEPQYVERIFLIFQRLHGRGQYPGVPASGWRSPRRSWSATVAVFGWSPSPGREAYSTSRCRVGSSTAMHNAADGKPIEILLVEDNPGDVRLAVEALRDGKVANRLHIVEDGVEAMSFLRREGRYADVPRPDLILLDLNLPLKDGREVLAEIKQDADLKRIPVVILTSSAAEQDVVQAYNLYANCYIVKPIDLDQFLKVVRSIEDFWLIVVTLPQA